MQREQLLNSFAETKCSLDIMKKRNEKLKGTHTTFWVNGVEVIKPNHESVQKLRTLGYQPNRFGCRVWSGNYIMMAYLAAQRKIVHKARVLELGAGWGLLSTYVSKIYHAQAIASDIDSKVHPYQQMLANINNTHVESHTLNIESLKAKEMVEYDVILGADICYSKMWQEQLLRIVDESYSATPPECCIEKPHIIIADLGRRPFMELSEQICKRVDNCTFKKITLEKPTRMSGYVLDIELDLQQAC